MIMAVSYTQIPNDKKKVKQVRKINIKEEGPLLRLGSGFDQPTTTKEKYVSGGIGASRMSSPTSIGRPLKRSHRTTPGFMGSKPRTS